MKRRNSLAALEAVKGIVFNAAKSVASGRIHLLPSGNTNSVSTGHVK